jgi:hypothetical protein
MQDPTQQVTLEQRRPSWSSIRATNEFDTCLHDTITVWLSMKPQLAVSKARENAGKTGTFALLKKIFNGQAYEF